MRNVVVVQSFAVLLLLAMTTIKPLQADVPLNRLTEAERKSGWKLLFDGKTTKGWRNYRSKSISKGWVVKDGILTRQGRRAGDIVTAKQFEHFELQIEYRISKGGNSGLMFHVTEESNSPWHTGPEVQIQDNVDGHDPEKSGWLYQLYKPVKPDWAKKFEKQVGFKGTEMDDATRPAGQWNHLYLRVTPQDGEVGIKGVRYFYFVKGSDDWNQRVAKSKFARFPNFGKPTKGHICLQDHGNLVAFRNIKIRELPADGNPPQPIDGTLSLKTVVAFPELEWDGWVPFDDDGKISPPLRAMQLTHAGDGSNRIFVADQRGMIHVFPNDKNAKHAKMFLDLREKTHRWESDNEEGLLGLAFHPDYRNNGQFFVYYHAEKEPRTAYVSRFRVSKNDPNTADPDSEELVMRIQQPFANHNGGSIAFGPDGYLYIALGDGGGRNDPMSLGQALKSRMGSILRIDVDHKTADRNYAIPKDNPFVGRHGALPEIYATGFRNVWRIAFDRKTGTLWAADVGQDLWEEIDIVKKGGNYGWSIREGTHLFANKPGAENVNVVEPVWEYDHRIGKSITGGYVYRGSKLPELAGHYLYGDYVSGKLWALQYDEKSGKVVRNMAVPWNSLPVMSFGEDEAGELYVTTPAANGKGIYRIVRTSE
ncbi:MAG: PQQ-dependent sugar dehydrogenase [Planctomycetes bacterium]|nr:PQQ-dependent sugar dehydrogenase [Planctomycetota bacterium]